jgi:hypothetical protein
MSVGAWGVSLVVGASLWSVERLVSMRTKSRLERCLENEHEDRESYRRVDERLADLPRKLADLVRGSIALRLALEGPIIRGMGRELAVSPWSRRDNLEAWDLRIVDLRRAVWVWRAGFARLEPSTCVQLRALGLQGVPLNRMLLHDLDRHEDLWDPGLWAAAPDRGQAQAALRQAWHELRRFEEVALACARSSYRIPA